LRVRKVWVTPEVEKVIGYCARVSNPQNQDNPDVSKLLAYCIKNHHWSIFEMGNLCVEIQTSRAISAQILRHRSFSFQEFSQRYATFESFETYEARRQDDKNRQNSIDDMDEETKEWFRVCQIQLQETCGGLYRDAINRGIAKEQARFLLPMETTTQLYMNGTIRSWIHYLQLRTENGTQKEHRDIALTIQQIFIEELPITSQALGWG